MTKPKSRSIKSCPFCAFQFCDIHHDNKIHWMFCLFCSACGPEGKYFGDAISKWNKRKMINRIAGIDFGNSDGQEHLKPFCLRACPFCGEAGEGLEIMGEKSTEVFWCSCNTCGTDGPYAYEKKIAVRLWNRRIRVNTQTEN